MINRIKIVATAFTCEPGLGSEYEVGWRWSFSLSKVASTLVLTRRSSYNNIPAVEEIDVEFGPSKKIDNVTFKALDIPFAEFFFKGRRFMRLHYLIWLFIVTIWIRRNKKYFDFNHHICFTASWLPPLSYFSGLPFIWGPIGTGSALPTWALLEFQGRIWNFVTQISYSFNPLISFIVKKSLLVIPINKHVYSLISGANAKNSLVYPAIAHEILDSNQRKPVYKSLDCATIIYAGRLIPQKLPELSLRVGQILLQKYPSLNFIMIGENLKNLKSLIKKDIKNLQILEQVPQKTFFEMLSNSQLLLFPTTEGSGFVALEALSRGIPIVCTDNSGPSNFIDNKGGISVKIYKSLEETALNIASACEKILVDEITWLEYSNAAVSQSHKFTWENLELALLHEYEGLYANRA